MHPTRLDHWIGGEPVASHADATTSLNPSEPQDMVAEVPVGTAAEVAAAVAKAAEAQRAWRAKPGPAKADALTAWAAALQSRAEELAGLIAREVGKPIAEAKGEVGRGVAILRYYAGEAVRDHGSVIPSQFPETLQFSLREPLGVVGLITPWNFPVAIPLWKAAPALAFGNAVVWKPSELSGAVASVLAETSGQAGLPAGLFNLVHGDGSTGAALAACEGVEALSFTGSARVGGLIAQACAARNAKHQTEMGGKNAGIVLEDANLTKAATLVAGGAFRYAGQKCTATSRVIVERPAMEAFLAELKRIAEALPLGPVCDPACAIGPLISDAARQRVLGALTGRDLLFGGPVPSPFEDGYFVAPTAVMVEDENDTLAQDELFGPVLAVIGADDAEHAIRLANATRYGLSASLFTQNIGNALRYIREIEVGLVRVNGDTTGVDPHAPFGGFKGSSSHTREQGPAARDFYTQVKTVQIGG